jgi:hypothetical protein
MLQLRLLLWDPACCNSPILIWLAGSCRGVGWLAGGLDEVIGTTIVCNTAAGEMLLSAHDAYS